MAIEGIFKPTAVRPKSQGHRTPSLQRLVRLISINFTLSTWLLLGACLQSATFLLLRNSIYAFLPSFALLLLRLLDSCLMATNLKPNKYMRDVINGKASAFSIDPDTGTFTRSPASSKIVIFLLTAKSNHPFGIFAPGYATIGAHVDRMYRGLEADPDAGFLGHTGWTRYDERGALSILNVSYWRDLEALLRFAHGPAHREAWGWWDKTLKEYGYVGINHEMFEAGERGWANVYINFQPTGLGATSFLSRGKEGKREDEWVSPLVDVSSGSFRTTRGRLGWDHDGVERGGKGEGEGRVY